MKISIRKVEKLVGPIGWRSVKDGVAFLTISQARLLVDGACEKLMDKATRTMPPGWIDPPTAAERQRLARKLANQPLPKK